MWPAGLSVTPISLKLLGRCLQSLVCLTRPPFHLRDAKLSVLEWDPSAFTPRTRSLHCWDQGDGGLTAGLREGRRAFPLPPRVIADPMGRCVCVVVWIHALGLREGVRVHAHRWAMTRLVIRSRPSQTSTDRAYVESATLCPSQVCGGGHVRPSARHDDDERGKCGDVQFNTRGGYNSPHVHANTSLGPWIALLPN